MSEGGIAVTDGAREAAAVVVATLDDVPDDNATGETAEDGNAEETGSEEKEAVSVRTRVDDDAVVTG